MFEARSLPDTEDVIFKWRLLVEEGRKTGHTFSQPDLIIAATALCHGLTVLSRDTSDYERARVPVVESTAVSFRRGRNQDAQDARRPSAPFSARLTGGRSGRWGAVRVVSQPPIRESAGCARPVNSPPFVSARRLTPYRRPRLTLSAIAHDPRLTIARIPRR